MLCLTITSVFFFLMIRRPPRSTRLTHSFPTRRSSDLKFGADDVKGWSNLIGGDVRFNLGEHVDIGATGMVRVGTDADTLSWAGGPTVTVAPLKNAHIIFGYNLAGFHDRDFDDSRFSRSVAYVHFKLKCAQTKTGRAPARVR